MIESYTEGLTNGITDQDTALETDKLQNRPTYRLTGLVTFRITRSQLKRKFSKESGGISRFFPFFLFRRLKEIKWKGKMKKMMPSESKKRQKRQQKKKDEEKCK